MDVLDLEGEKAWGSCAALLLSPSSPDGHSRAILLTYVPSACILHFRICAGLEECSMGEPATGSSFLLMACDAHSLQKSLQRAGYACEI